MKITLIPPELLPFAFERPPSPGGRPRVPRQALSRSPSNSLRPRVVSSNGLRPRVNSLRPRVVPGWRQQKPTSFRNRRPDSLG